MSDPMKVFVNGDGILHMKCAICEADDPLLAVYAIRIEPKNTLVMQGTCSVCKTVMTARLKECQDLSPIKKLYPERWIEEDDKESARFFSDTEEE